MKSPSQQPVAPTAPLLEGGADADRMATAEYSSSSVTFLFGIAPEAAPRVHRTLEQRWPLTDIPDSSRLTPTAKKIGRTKIAKISKLVLGWSPFWNLLTQVPVPSDQCPSVPQTGKKHCRIFTCFGQLNCITCPLGKYKFYSTGKMATPLFLNLFYLEIDSENLNTPGGFSPSPVANPNPPPPGGH